MAQKMLDPNLAKRANLESLYKDAYSYGLSVLPACTRLSKQSGGKLTAEDKQKLAEMIKEYKRKIDLVDKAFDAFSTMPLQENMQWSDKIDRLMSDYLAFTELQKNGFEPKPPSKEFAAEQQYYENLRSQRPREWIAQARLRGQLVWNEYEKLMQLHGGKLTKEDKEKLAKLIQEYYLLVESATGWLNTMYKSGSMAPNERRLLQSEHRKLYQEYANVVQLQKSLKIQTYSANVTLPGMDLADMIILERLPEEEKMPFIRVKWLFSPQNLAAAFDRKTPEKERQVLLEMIAFAIDKYGPLIDKWTRDGIISTKSEFFGAYITAYAQPEIKSRLPSPYQEVGKALCSAVTSDGLYSFLNFFLPLNAYEEASVAQGFKYGEQPGLFSWTGVKYWGELAIDSFFLATGAEMALGVYGAIKAMALGVPAAEALGPLLKSLYKGGVAYRTQAARIGEVGPFIRLARVGQTTVDLWKVEGVLPKAWQGAKIVGNVIMVPADMVRKMWRIYTLPAKTLEAMISKSSAVKYGVPIVLQPGVNDAIQKMPWYGKAMMPSLWATNGLFMLSWTSDLVDMLFYHPEKYGDSEKNLNLAMFGTTLLLHVPSLGKGVIMRYLGASGEKADAISKAIFEEMANGTFTVESLKKILSANGIGAEKASGLMQKFEELKLWLAIGKPVVQSDVVLRLQQMGITKNADLISKAIAEDLEAGKLTAKGIQEICKLYGATIDATQAGQILESVNSVYKLAQQASSEFSSGKPGSAFLNLAYRYRKFFEAGYYGGVTVSQVPVAKEMLFDLDKKPPAARDMAQALVGMPPVVADDLTTLTAYAKNKDWTNLEKQLAKIDGKIKNPPPYLASYGAFVKNNQAYLAAKILLDIHKSLMAGTPVKGVDALGISTDIEAYQAIFGRNDGLEALAWSGIENVGEQKLKVPGFMSYVFPLEGEKPRILSQSEIDGIIGFAYNALKPKEKEEE